MATRLAWGILSTGNIAGQFCEGVAAAARSRLAAVASRAPQRATEFAQRYAIPVAHSTYEALLADPQVDAVYIGLPNHMHYEWTLKALRAGKHVLCEKPIAVDAAQTEEMFDVARREGRLLVEAFMYLTHPLTQAWLAQVRAGAIGHPELVRASFCFYTASTQTNIRFNRACAGGALMDVGCYCVSLAQQLAQAEPTRVEAVAKFHASGVDEFNSVLLAFKSGLTVSFQSAMRLHADNTLMVSGDKGYILVPIPWKPPLRNAQYVLAQSIPPRMDGGAAAAARGPQTIAIDAGLPLYALEADAFARSVLDGDAPFLSPADSLAQMRLLDRIRQTIGLPWL